MGCGIVDQENAQIMACEWRVMRETSLASMKLTISGVVESGIWATSLVAMILSEWFPAKLYKRPMFQEVKNACINTRMEDFWTICGILRNKQRNDDGILITVINRWLEAMKPQFCRVKATNCIAATNADDCKAVSCLEVRELHRNTSTFRKLSANAVY